MSNKNETPSKSPADTGTESKTTEVKPELQQTGSGSDDKPATPANNPNELSKEVVELLMELKETVKALNVRWLNPKTLRRSLSNVKDIMDDINQLYAQD